MLQSSHMTENISFNEEELFETVVEEGIIQGVVDQPAYFDLIDEIIEDLRREAELGDDQNLELHAENLKARFPEYLARQVD